MKNQNTGSNRQAAGQFPLRSMAMWGLCLGGVGVAIAANTAREAKNPIASQSASVAALPGAQVTKPAALEPLSKEFKPSSSFPGVMVRSIPEGTSPKAAPQTQAAGKTFRWAGKTTGIVTKGTSSYSGNTTRTGPAPVERKGKTGGASLRFDRALFPREGIAIDSEGHMKYECVDENTLDERAQAVANDVKKEGASHSQTAPAKNASASH